MHRIIKGRAYQMDVDIYDADGNVYTPAPGEQIVMTVKKQRFDAAPVLVKTGPHIEIAPEDTADLPTGSYEYDVVLIRADGKPYTIIPGDCAGDAYAKLEIVRGVYDG